MVKCQYFLFSAISLRRGHSQYLKVQGCTLRKALKNPLFRSLLTQRSLKEKCYHQKTQHLHLFYNAVPPPLHLILIILTQTYMTFNLQGTHVWVYNTMYMSNLSVQNKTLFMHRQISFHHLVFSTLSHSSVFVNGIYISKQLIKIQ